MAEVKFGYTDKAGEWRAVTTLEEDEYPAYYHQRSGEKATRDDRRMALPSAQPLRLRRSRLAPKPEPLFEGHREFQENQRGVSYDTLLLPYLRGATEITIVDPYVRQFHQARNLMELIEAARARSRTPPTR